MGFELIWPSFVCLIHAAGLVFAELRGARREQWLFKPLAAAFFVLQALLLEPFQDLYGQLVLLALVLSAAGDVLLLPRERPALFKAGMLAFGLAHVAYAAAFFAVPVDDGPGPLGALAFLPPALLVVGVMRWLFPKLPRADRIAVGIYAVIIGVMLGSALMFAGWALPWWVGLAAAMFAVSDLFVARDRFVKREPKNAIAITPLYFGAQCLFAVSVL